MLPCTNTALRGTNTWWGDGETVTIHREGHDQVLAAIVDPRIVGSIYSTPAVEHETAWKCLEDAVMKMALEKAGSECGLPPLVDLVGEGDAIPAAT